MECCVGLCVFVLISLVAGHTRDEDVKENLMRESHIYSRIFNSPNYIPELPPSSSSNDTITVYLDFMFYRIEDLDQQNHILTASYHMSQSWNDPRLTWNISEYDGVSRVIVPVSKIWKPDLTLYNTGVPITQLIPITGQMAHVSYDGSVIWVPQVTSKTYCPLDLTYFPSDTQKCELILGSWVYKTSLVHFEFGTDTGVSIEEHYFSDLEHPSWRLNIDSLKGKITPRKFPCCPERYDIIRIGFSLTRKSEYLKVVVFGPPILLAMLVPMLFVLPVDAPEKSSLGALVLIALTIEMSLQIYYTPPSYIDVPHLVKFTTGTFVLATLGIVCASIVSSMARKSSSPRTVPGWVRTMFLGRCGLRRLICLSVYTPVNTQPNLTSALRKGDNNSHDPENNLQEHEMGSIQTPELKEIVEYMRTLIQRISSKDAVDKVNKEWMEIARVFDRLLFILFFSLFVLMCLALLTF